MLGAIPIVEQLLLMKCCPLDHQSEDPRRKMPGKDCERANLDQRHLVAVERVEMGRSDARRRTS